MPKKIVKFNSIVRVMLVNTRDEYESHEIDKDVWWSGKELADIRRSILLEIKELMQQRPELSFDDCQKEILTKTT